MTKIFNKQIAGIAKNTNIAFDGGQTNEN